MLGVFGANSFKHQPDTLEKGGFVRHIPIPTYTDPNAFSSSFAYM